MPCGGCDRHYFGESGRSLNTRIKEHKYAVSRHDINNSFYKHRIETLENNGTAHNIDWEGAKLLHANNCWYNRLVIESSLIKTYPNFNSMKSTLGIDHYSAKLVVNSIPNLNL